jgi:DNA-3-methyladenine glycosylase II/AraC family transcriptional regulator of adaptative response / DNA-3-methyladenine glycosylase II
VRGEAVTLRLAFTPPYAVRPLLDALAAHAVPGLEHTDVDAGTHTRAVTARGGPALVRLSFDGPDHVRARLQLTDPDDVPAITSTMRRWLDLDADPAQVDAALGTDELLAPLVSRRPGLRVLGSVDAFETAVLTVLGQQVSLAACRTFAGRLLAAYGAPGLDGFRAFPSPKALAAVSPTELQSTVGLTHTRTRTVLALAAAVADGLHLAGEPAAVRKALLTLPGIGPWTADYLCVRALGDRDAYPAGDLVLRRALGGVTAREAAALGERWRPFRAYAVFHLWTHTAYR